ncbi:MAG TPA: butyrate kinase [Bacteroidales bacterium]|nr:butyrate kinase [Bacteroidales bacterium]HPF04346.1 butyrate kinase [Bacteroidales bacterium]HPR12045.1 butyrate kinase [Bacteroidales bacterium]HRW85920.1 butyrate kinase [Bacteroidales bacterium]
MPSEGKKRLLLIINPGSTSTKFALYEESSALLELNLEHSVKDLSVFNKITDQLQFRKELILKELRERNADLSRLSAVIGRGGLVKPIESGIYEVSQRMIDDLRAGLLGQHASNLGGLIAHEIAAVLPGTRAFIVDPVVVDELQPVARFSGHPEIKRISIFHALNQKAVARTYASYVKRRYEDLNLIIAHLGGGISVGAHSHGRVVDVNNALNGDGPFSPERSGGLPSGQLAELCFSGRYSYQEVRSMITGKGGMVAYLGTNNFREVSRMAEGGDAEAELVIQAAAYQVSKEIGSMAAVLCGNVDAIILTGGLAFNQYFTDRIKSMTSFIAEIFVYPGEDEIKSLAYNGLLALDGKIDIRQYS